MDVTGPGSSPVAGFGISGIIELAGSTVTVLVD
jgi:hypothetical protein